MTQLYPENELHEGRTLDVGDRMLVNGRFDVQAPIANAQELKRVWLRAELVYVDNAGHSGRQPSLAQEVIRATDRFVERRSPSAEGKSG
jgi:proline iminopeptidase